MLKNAPYSPSNNSLRNDNFETLKPQTEIDETNKQISMIMLPPRQRGFFNFKAHRMLYNLDDYHFQKSWQYTKLLMFYWMKICIAICKHFLFFILFK